MKKKAEALAEYQKAAMTNMVVQKLPEVLNLIAKLILTMFQIIAGITKPLMECESINLVSSGDGDLGASKLTNEVLNILNSLPQTVNSLTGVDIRNSESASLLQTIE